jgi:hypothetical protein
MADEPQRHAALFRIVDNSPALAAANDGSPPTVRLKCPKGHRLLEVQVDAGYGDDRLYPVLVPLAPGVARPREPAGRAAQTCTTTGCGALLDESSTCPGHGPVDEIGWRSPVGLPVAQVLVDE